MEAADIAALERLIDPLEVRDQRHGERRPEVLEAIADRYARARESMLTDRAYRRAIFARRALLNGLDDAWVDSRSGPSTRTQRRKSAQAGHR